MDNMDKKQVFEAMLRNNEEHYIKTLESFVRVYPKIFYRTVLSTGGKIYIYDLTGYKSSYFYSEYTFTIKADLWYKKREIDRVPTFCITIDIPASDLDAIAPYVLNKCKDKSIDDYINKQTGIYETKKGTWFDKLVSKATKVNINVNYKLLFLPSQQILEDFRQFFGLILERMQKI